jgi:hypothetical protein
VPDEEQLGLVGVPLRILENANDSDSDSDIPMVGPYSFVQVVGYGD